MVMDVPRSYHTCLILLSFPLPGTHHPRQPMSDLETTPLEAFPHLLKRIGAMWGTWELDVFIHSLLMDSREGSRAGFPMEAAADLMFLAKCNKMVRALDLAKKSGLKLDEAYRNIDTADHEREGGGLWTDPTVAKDVTRVSPPTVRVAETKSSGNGGGGLFSLFGQLTFFLVRSKILPAAIVLILVVKFVRKIL